MVNIQFIIGLQSILFVIQMNIRIHRLVIGVGISKKKYYILGGFDDDVIPPGLGEVITVQQCQCHTHILR